MKNKNLIKTMILSSSLLFGCKSNSVSVSFPRISDFTGVHLSESISLPKFEEIENFNFFLEGHCYVLDWKECNSKKKWLYNSVKDYFKVERDFSGMRVGIGAYDSGFFQILFKDKTTFSFGVGTVMIITESADYLKNSDNDPFCTDKRFTLEKSSYEFAQELKKCLNSYFDKENP